MAWTWMPDHVRTLDVEAQPSALAFVGDSLLSSLAEPIFVRRKLQVQDREGVSVFVAQPLGSAAAQLTITVSSGVHEISWDLFSKDAHHPGRLQMLIESALLALDQLTLTAPENIADKRKAEEAAEVEHGRWPDNELVCKSQHGDVVLLQPRVLEQWHGNACGYHAWYNAQKLLAAAEALAHGELPAKCMREALQDEQAFHTDMFTTLRTLQSAAKEGSSWRPAALRSLGLVQSHMRHIFQEKTDAKEQQFFIIDADTGGVKQAESSLASLQSSGNAKAFAFLLGSVTHWVAAAATITPQGPLILLADSFNKPLLDDTSAQALAQVCIENFFSTFVTKVTSEMPVYDGAPDDVFRRLWENGVPEWWKGKEKDSLYWKHRPSQLRTNLMGMEIEATRKHLQELECILQGVS